MPRFLALWALLLGLPAWAQQELEVIPLRSQTVDRVLPALRPLLEPGASLSGMNNQLFLRASARNRQEIKKALAAIDAPARRLVIRISQNRQADADNARVWDSRSVHRESASQMVQTVEGGRAFIQVGRSVPLPMRQVFIGPGGAAVSEGVVYRDIGQGFYAEPHLNGERVTLEISQQADTPGRSGAGSIQVQRLSTTVTGRLGEWIELGATGRQAEGGQGGMSLSTGDVRESGSIWLRVEELP